jgi:hypothetical protein
LDGNFRFAEAKETPEAHGQAPRSGSAMRIRGTPASPDLGYSRFLPCLTEGNVSHWKKAQSGLISLC